MVVTPDWNISDEDIAEMKPMASLQDQLYKQMMADLEGKIIAAFGAERADWFYRTHTLVVDTVLEDGKYLLKAHYEPNGHLCGSR